MAYTPNLVVGVWAGNADNSPMHNIRSTSISWRAARDFMEAALEGKEALDFQKPDGVDMAKVCVPSGMLPSEYCGKTVEDLFVTDALPKEKDNWWQPLQDRYPHRPAGDRDDAAAVRAAARLPRPAQ